MISRAFQTFRDSIKRPTPLRVVEPKRLLKPKNALLEAKYQRNYEPTPAIYFNECDYRRWCRVNEWFAEFGPEVEKSERTVLTQ